MSELSFRLKVWRNKIFAGDDSPLEVATNIVIGLEESPVGTTICHEDLRNWTVTVPVGKGKITLRRPTLGDAIAAAIKEIDAAKT